MYPTLEINVNKLKHNVKTLIKLCSEKGIDIIGVSKVFCSNPDIVSAYIDGGLKYVGDSRIENLKGISHLDVCKVLLRLPSPSNARDVVKYSDLSLNSETETIAELDKHAREQGKRHSIILMIELGDLREGVLSEDFIKTIDNISKLPNIKLAGIGTNLTCFGAIIPKPEHMHTLVKLGDILRNRYSINDLIISGGNSSGIPMVASDTMPEGINNLRLGEALVMGTDAAYKRRIDNTYDDIFILKAEVIELKYKPSYPIGEIGVDALGNVPVFKDKGIRRRAILSIGKQDVRIDSLLPLDKNIEIVGASSDHLIVDVTDSENEYGVGSVISFNAKYPAVLSLCTSKYVAKTAVK